ncbi:MAG: hypothetical protein AB1627_12135 [Chloroflexota bacterium]
MPRFTITLAGLAVVAAMTVAACGGASAQPPTPEPSGPPVTEPSPAPSLAPAPAPITVSIIDPYGKDVTATIDDASGRLVRATSAQPSDGGVVPGDQLSIANDGPNRLRLEWTDLPCGTGYRIAIDAGATAIAVSREACGGDLLPTDRIVVLEFSGPIDAADVAGSVDLPIAGE